MQGTLYSRFEVIETLKSSPGQFADESYKARESSTDAPGTRPRVVLMRSLPRSADSRIVLDTIVRASQLRPHSAILATYGVIEAPEEPGQPPTPFLISEYAQGMLLNERIKRLAPFSLRTALDIGIVVSDALAYADAAGLDTHDIRPQDIVCTSDGEIKIADIEVGQAIRTADRPVMTYVSGSACAAGLIYEMLTGKSVLESNEPVSMPVSSAPSSLRALLEQTLAGSQITLAEFCAELKSIKSDAASPSQSRSNTLNNRPLPPAQFLNRSSAPNATVDNPRFRIASASNAAPEIMQSEHGKDEIYASDDDLPRTMPEPKRVVARSIDDDADRGASLNWPKIIGRTFASLIALAIVGFCVYVGMVVSNVPNDVTVPSLIGQQFTDATQKADQLHIHVVQTGHNYSDTWPQGAIFVQDPLPGRMIKANKDVDVSVSDGPRLTPVPDLSQMTLKRAQGTLQDSGLPVGKITYTYDDTIEKGIVTTQTPQPSANIARTTPVNLTVSKGPPPPAAPTNLSATCTVSGEIDLAWGEGQSPQTYDVYRDGVKIASEIPEATYSDVNVLDSTVHVYNITAVNSNGESPKSASVSCSSDPNASAASTPSPDATPVVQRNTGSANNASKERQFSVKFRIPNTGTSHKVQIDIQDTTGTTEVYNQEMSGGDTVNRSFQAFGNRVILRIFIDGKLVRQQPE